MSHLKIVPPQKSVDAVEQLRQNLVKLTELQQRLRIMLRELQELVQEDTRG